MLQEKNVNWAFVKTVLRLCREDAKLLGRLSKRQEQAITRELLGQCGQTQQQQSYFATIAGG